MTHPNDPTEIPAAAGLPPAIGDVLRLFRTELDDVAFPTLDRAVLESALGAVTGKLEQVEQARVLLRAEEAELKRSKEALIRACERGLAYARVYAQDNETLLAAVDAIPSLRPRANGLVRDGKPRQPRATSPALLEAEAVQQLPLEDGAAA